MKDIKYDNAKALNNNNIPCHILSLNNIETSRMRELPLGADKILTRKKGVQKNIGIQIMKLHPSPHCRLKGGLAAPLTFLIKIFKANPQLKWRLPSSQQTPETPPTDTNHSVTPIAILS